jgi:DtxR family Mn-dependent transcriptional regulator
VTAERASRPAHGALTGQAEDYLKAIYESAKEKQNGAAAATNDIAARLGIAPASVSGMLQRLARLGLVKVERYRGARLTAQGRRIALQLLRRHRIIEVFLTTQLGYGWDDVHDEAERLEHAASSELVERMAKALGNPRSDPHGAPIPTTDGEVDERRLPTLAELPELATATVVRVSDRDPAFLRYLDALGIRPGSVVTVLLREPFDGPITVKLGKAKQVLGSGAAARVYIEQQSGPKSRTPVVRGRKRQ